MTLETLIQSTGSYFRSLCKIEEFPIGFDCEALTLPAGFQFVLWHEKGRFGFAPLVTKNGESEKPSVWMSFEQARTILTAYAQAWEAMNPEGVFEETLHFGEDRSGFCYGGFTAYYWPKTRQYSIVVGVFNPASDLKESFYMGIEVAAGVGLAHEACQALYAHLQSLKGGGK